MQIQPIIEKVSTKLIEDELSSIEILCKTNKANRDVYILDHRNSPNVLREIGRLREISFRDAGGGTGKSIDLDEYDLDETNPFKQLIVWDEKDKEIIGGYRFIRGDEMKIKNGKVDTPTTELFDISDNFIQNYLPYTIELGRSFVQPIYQPHIDPRKGLFSLDNIWDGLGAILNYNKDIKYYFGKITMYPSFNKKSRDLILFFLHKYFGDKSKLVVPHIPLKYYHDVDELSKILTSDNYEQDYKLLQNEVRKLNENIPPLVNAYMNLSSTMMYFGTALNPEFGAVEESGILIAVEDVNEKKKERYFNQNKE